MEKQFTANPSSPNLPELPKRTPWRHDFPELNKLWWKRPETVRILMYMD